MKCRATPERVIVKDVEALALSEVLTGIVHSAACPDPSKGDRVYFGKYAGVELEPGVRVLHHSEILAIHVDGEPER